MGSSSKKKSSKKKSAKISSKPKKMKKSRRNANKKRGHRHDSSSEDSLSPRAASLHSSDSLSDTDSMSSVSMSSSSSEGTYRSRKKGSRLRKNAKSSSSRKPKIREDLSRGLKRKRSKKKDIDSKSRKKYRKKKPRRHDSVSSASSDSNSCSTCRSSSSIEESDSKRRRIKSTEKQKRRGEFNTETNLSEERTHGSPNGSIDRSRSRDQSCRVSQDEEAFVGESKSRRLRSVITVALKPHDDEESQLEKDLLIEEAIHDRNNIPSSKTIDASGSRSKRDVPPPASSDGKSMESSSEEERFLIDQRLNEASEYRKGNTVQNSQNPFSDEPKNGFEKDTGDRVLADASPVENDLETILRRKALENLKKFRVKRETNVKTKVNEVKTDDLDANQVSIEKDVAVREGLPELGSSNVSGRAIIDERMKPRFKKDSPRPAMSRKKTSDGEHTDKKSDAVNLNTIVAIDAPPVPGNPINDLCPSQAFDPDSGSGNLSHKGKFSGTESVANQKATVLSSDKEASVKTSETNTADKTNYSTSPVRTDDPRKRTRDVATPGSDCGELSSGVQRTSEGQSSNDQKNEAKDGSEWKQKKMSVMRGGEMVEVSYKVYIPQRTPALARRRLKR